MRGIVSETPEMSGARVDSRGEPIATSRAEALCRSSNICCRGHLMGSVLITSTSYAKPEYTKSTKKACIFCHADAKAKPKELTEAGKYFKEHNNSLDGFKAAK